MAVGKVRLANVTRPNAKEDWPRDNAKISYIINTMYKIKIHRAGKRQTLSLGSLVKTYYQVTG